MTDRAARTAKDLRLQFRSDRPPAEICSADCRRTEGLFGSPVNGQRKAPEGNRQDSQERAEAEQPPHAHSVCRWPA